jgi:hypothetical protein
LGGHYHHGHGYRYAHGWRGYGLRGVTVAGGYYSQYYHRHSCWWYRHYDPYNMPSWCGAYSYAPAYDYSYDYDYGDYGPSVGFAYGPGYYGGGYGYARRHGFHGGHRFYGAQPGGFASAHPQRSFATAHMGVTGGTHFAPRMGGANVSGMGSAHIAGGFHGGMSGGNIGGGGLRVH